MDRPAQYEIQVEGAMSARWAEWFHGMDFTGHEEGSRTITVLTGCVPDQAALLGMLQSIHNIGLLILSVKRSSLS